jgi:hypothetical protein
MPGYDSFMLRVWRRSGADDGQWVARLEHLPDGSTRTFHSLQDLLEELACVLAVAPWKGAVPPIADLENQRSH